MKFPFWLLIVFSNPETSQITSITQFQSADQCLAAKALLETKITEQKSQFNMYDGKPAVMCEKVIKR